MLKDTPGFLFGEIIIKRVEGFLVPSHSPVKVKLHLHSPVKASYRLLHNNVCTILSYDSRNIHFL